MIEMLVALAMMATIASMVYGSYAATSQSVEAYGSRLRCSERAGQILRLMARQIRCSYLAPNDPNMTASAGAVGPAQTPAPPAPRPRTLVNRRAPIFRGNAQNPGGEILDFVSTAGLGTGLGGPQGLTRIQYRHNRATGTLSIHCEPYMDRLNKTASPQTGQPILEHVTAMDIEFFDGRKWSDKWSDRKNREVPRAVRIRLTLTDEKERSHDFGTTVQIQSRTTVSQTTSKQTVGSRPL